MNINRQMYRYLAEVGVGVHIKRNKEIIRRKGFLEESRHYDVIVSNQSGDSFRYMYSQGSAIKYEPSVLDVLYYLILDYDSGRLSFEDFCSELGYAEDSIEDYRLYREIKAVHAGMLNVLGEDVIKRICDIVSNY